MIFIKSIWLHFGIIISLCLVAYADELRAPSQPQIPLLFEAASSSYSLSIVDLNTFFPINIPFNRTEFHVYSAASQPCAGKGIISFYGENDIQSGEKKFDFGSHQLYFHTTIGNAIFGVGAGYDYDSKNNIKILETTKMNGSSVSEKNNCLYINDWEENSFFGNVNGSLVLDKNERLLLGIEMTHSVKNGVEYSETAEYSTDVYQGFQDNITSFNYDAGAYRNKLSAGTGILYEYQSKRGGERLRLFSIKYNQELEHSDLLPISGVKSYFFSSEPDDIQFSGKNNSSRSLALDLLLSERSPDKVYLENVHEKTVNMYVKFVNFALQYEEICKSILSINQWNMNDIYYGVDEKKSKHYPLSFLVNNVTDCILFGNFRIRFDSHFDGNVELYSKEEFDVRSALEFTPCLGYTLPFRDIVVLDINYYLFPVTTSFEKRKNSFDFGLDVTNTSQLQLRIAILK